MLLDWLTATVCVLRTIATYDNQLIETAATPSLWLAPWRMLKSHIPSTLPNLVGLCHGCLAVIAGHGYRFHHRGEGGTEDSPHANMGFGKSLHVALTRRVLSQSIVGWGLALHTYPVHLEHRQSAKSLSTERAIVICQHGRDAR